MHFEYRMAELASSIRPKTYRKSKIRNIWKFKILFEQPSQLLLTELYIKAKSSLIAGLARLCFAKQFKLSKLDN